MRLRFAAAIGAAVGLMAAAAGAQPVLSGAIAFETDSSGSASGGYWNTLGGDGVWNLYVIAGTPGGAFVNSGDSTSTSISIPLTAGVHSFTLQGDDFVTTQYRGVNLFFDGDNINPGISVFEQIAFTGGQRDGSTTRELNGNPIGGANSLSCVVDGYVVTLSAYSVHTEVANQDRVTDFNDTPNQINDDLITFTLTVEQAPVPVLGGAGLAALALLLAIAGMVMVRRLG